MMLKGLSIFLAINYSNTGKSFWSSIQLWLERFDQQTISYLVYGILSVSVVFVLIVVNKRKLSVRGSIFGEKRKRPNRSISNELGSGDLATTEHIKRWIKKTKTGDTLLPVKELRGSGGLVLKKGNLVIPNGERNRHILIIAKTGSGKTSKLILPVLYNDCLCPLRSTIVIDSKPEMWSKLAAMTRKHNPKKNILLFNPLDTARSLSWNILAKVEDDTDAKLIANTIVMATDNPNSRSDSPFFRNNALQVLYSIMLGLLNDPNDKISMPRIHEIVHSGMTGICDWLEARPHAIRNSRTFVDLARSGSQNADTVLSELGMRLSAWDLHAIRSTTFLNELDLETIISQPTLFIIEVRESELEMLRPMANVIVIEILRFLTKRAEGCKGQTLPRPVSLVIDEFASALGRLPDIHVKLNTLRSRNVSIVAAIQSIGQIKAAYATEADPVLSGFSTKIFMPAVDFQDAEWASKETGTMTIRYKTLSEGKNRRIIDFFANRNENIQEQVQQRAVLTPDEIGKPADNICTFFMPNTPVFQGHLIPYYEIPEVISRFNSQVEDLKLRDKPIEYEDKPPPPPSAKNQRSKDSPKDSKEQQLKTLEQLKGIIGWNETSGDPKTWWESFETANVNNIASVVELARDLATRKAVIADFYYAYARSGASSVKDVLVYLDNEVYGKLKTELDWEGANDVEREWWTAFESSNKENFITMIHLSRELIKRKATIAQFFEAYVNSEKDNVPEVLKNLDKMISEKRFKSVDQVVEIKPSHDLEEVKDQQPALENFFGTSINPKQETEDHNGTGHSSTNIAKNAANKLHIESFFEMGEEFLRNGQINDFQALIGLAREDNHFTAEDIEQLESLIAKVAE